MTKLNTATLPEGVTHFLAALVQARCNLLLSGPLRTDSAACLAYVEGLIPKGRRVVRLESQPTPTDPATGDPLARLAAAQPDHILVPCWGSDNFVDVLRLLGVASGVVAFTYGSSPRDALAALEILAAQSLPTLPLPSVRQHFSSGLHMVLHVEPLTRDDLQIVKITQVLGMEGDVVVMQDIFIFDDSEGRRALRPTGIRPRMLRLLEEQGIDLPESTFDTGRRF